MAMQETCCARSQWGRNNVAIDWSRDEQSVVTFGRLYLNTLAPTRNYTPPASKLTSISRLFTGPFDELDEGVASVTLAYVVLHPPDAGLPTDSVVDIDEGGRRESLTDAPELGAVNGASRFDAAVSRDR